MTEIRKARAEDFEKVYPLLPEVGDLRLTKDDWRRLFINHWEDRQDYFGYVMMDGARAVGFIGLLFSKRLINKKIENFCNLSTWIVKEQYRSESLSLLFPVFNLKEYTTTVFTASEITCSVFNRFGYKHATTKRRIIPPISPAIFSRKGCSVEFGNKIKGRLNARDAKIYSDHLKFKCVHLLIKSAEGDCYAVLRRTVRRSLPLAQIEYIGNLSVFLKYIAKAAARICLRLRAIGLMTYERYLRGGEIKYSITIREAGPHLYKSKNLNEDEVDTLYSEIFVLDL